MSTLPKVNGSGMNVIISAVSWGFKMTLETFSYIGRIFSHFKVSVQKTWSEKKKNETAGMDSWKVWTIFGFMVIGRWIASFFRAFSKTVPTWPPKPAKKKK